MAVRSSPADAQRDVNAWLSLSVENKPKKRSLSRRIDYARLRSEGRKINLSRWLVLFYRRNDLGYLRYGLSINKKVGRAVLRNRLKRWSRECLRQQIRKGNDFGFDTHFVFRVMEPGFYRNLEFKEFESRMDLAFRKLGANHES